jgi:hypothetical protein
MTDAPMNWNDLANTRVGEVEPPKLLPAGHYAAIITGPGKVENKGQKQTLCVTYPIQLTEPLADVDAEAFASSDGFKQGGYELNFWITPNSLFRFTEFGKALGASDDLSVPEMSEHISSSGEAFAIRVKHEPAKDNPSRVFIRLEVPIALSVFQGLSQPNCYAHKLLLLVRGHLPTALTTLNRLHSSIESDRRKPPLQSDYSLVPRGNMGTTFCRR